MLHIFALGWDNEKNKVSLCKKRVEQIFDNFKSDSCIDTPVLGSTR